MRPFKLLFHLFALGYTKIHKKMELSSVTMFSDLYDLNITHDGYTDTTAELEELLKNRNLMGKKHLEGFDQRFPLAEESPIAQQITLNMYKYEFLKKLTDNSVSNYDKLQHIEECEKMLNDQKSKYMSELFKGLLFSEW